MALSFGSNAPSVDTSLVSNGGNLSYGSNAGNFSFTDWLFSTDNLSSGIPIIGSQSEYLDAVSANGVNTSQIDGTSGFTSALSGLASAVLASMGAQNDTPTVTQVSSSSGSVAGFDLKTIAIVGLIGAAVYYVAVK
jgi:hypothetical protein